MHAYFIKLKLFCELWWIDGKNGVDLLDGLIDALNRVEVSECTFLVDGAFLLTWSTPSFSTPSLFTNCIRFLNRL